MPPKMTPTIASASRSRFGGAGGGIHGGVGPQPPAPQGGGGGAPHPGAGPGGDAGGPDPVAVARGASMAAAPGWTGVVGSGSLGSLGSMRAKVSTQAAKMRGRPASP